MEDIDVALVTALYSLSRAFFWRIILVSQPAFLYPNSMTIIVIPFPGQWITMVACCKKERVVSETKRKNFSGEFKTKVAIEGIPWPSDGWTLGRSLGCIQAGRYVEEELQRSGIQPIWCQARAETADPSASPERLYSEIGRLKMELDWLKKSWNQPVEKRKQWVSTVEPLALTRQCELAGVTTPLKYILPIHPPSSVAVICLKERSPFDNHLIAHQNDHFQPSQPHTTQMIFLGNMVAK